MEKEIFCLKLRSVFRASLSKSASIRGSSPGIMTSAASTFTDSPEPTATPTSATANAAAGDVEDEWPRAYVLEVDEACEGTIGLHKYVVEERIAVHDAMG